MKFYNGFPREQGSTDFCDSARMAGILSLLEFNDFVMPNYLDKYNNVVRSNQSNIFFDKCFNPTTTSRDQIIPLVAGLHKQNMNGITMIIKEWLKERKWICPNGDILTASQKNHIMICANYEPSLIGNLWLWLDVLYSCFIDPLAEPNQLICLMKVHPNKAYLKFWCKWNKQWRNSILNYWSENEGAWRGEPELAELMIKTIEEDVK